MRTVLVRLGDVVGIGAFAVFALAALWLLYLWVTAMATWMGWPGLLVGFATTPCAVLFPFVYWYVEGVFPTNEFVVWALSIGGVAVSIGWKRMRPR